MTMKQTVIMVIDMDLKKMFFKRCKSIFHVVAEIEIELTVKKSTMATGSSKNLQN